MVVVSGWDANGIYQKVWHFEFGYYDLFVIWFLAIGISFTIVFGLPTPIPILHP